MEAEAFTYDGPHTELTTVAAARTAAEAARFLNNATGPHAATAVPDAATVYEVLGSLGQAADRYGQLFKQLDGALLRMVRENRIEVVDGQYLGSPVHAVAAAGEYLARARWTAGMLAEELRAARAALTWAGAPDGDAGRGA